MSFTTQDLIAQAKSRITEWDVATAARELAVRKGIILLDVREPAEFGEAARTSSRSTRPIRPARKRCSIVSWKSWCTARQAGAAPSPPIH